MKFKKGDKVKRICEFDAWESYFNKNHVGTVTDVNHYGYLEIDNKLFGGQVYWFSKNFELVQPKQFKPSDLKERWVVKTKDQGEFVVTKVDGNNISFVNLEDYKFFRYNGELNEFDMCLTDDLKYLPNNSYNIVEVYKPHYSTVWTRNEVKEVTMKEVCEKFGCEVRIIEED